MQLKNKTEKTICAIATSLNNNSIGIIRISGPEAISITQKIFKTKNKKEIDISQSHKVYYGFVFFNDEIIDEVICLTMRAPKSYTKEDVVEIHSHGSQNVLQKILELLLDNGATLAEAGEFTKRAFLNGRIDLSKAEAVIDIINSQTDYQRKAAISQLTGNIENKINSYREEILNATAYIEAALDDPEHISLDNYKYELKNTIIKIKNEIQTIISNYQNGKIIKEGINTVILGKPNVGKSSLLNTLLGENRAIVTDIAGTTRDTIKESINIDGLLLNIIDTAGIREIKEDNNVEKIGINKAIEEATNADLIIYLLDINKDLNEDFSLKDKDINIIEKFKNKKIIYLLNKSDLLQNKITKKIKDNQILFSTITKEGLNELKTKIKKLFISGEINFNNQIFINNERQLESFKQAKNSLENVLTSINKNVSEDFYTIDLMDSYNFLSQIIGKDISEDLINQIFSKFCMGK